MADWYVSSAAYATVSSWAASTAYTVGQLIKPTAPTANREYVFRCTVAGTSGGSEPTWSSAVANNATIVSGGATFANVSGQSTYGWSAAAGKLSAIVVAASNRPAAGDRVFLSSDHTESATTTYGFSTSGFGLIAVISVNRAGSVPPVAADITPGATISNTAGALTLDNLTDLYWEGITFSSATGATAGNIIPANTGTKSVCFRNCTLSIPNTNVSSRISLNTSSEITLDNTTVQFGATGQGFAATAAPSFIWLNTPSAIPGATLPTSLFTNATSTTSLSVVCRGVDLSAIAGTLLGPAASTGWVKALLDSCKIASGATRLGTAGTNAGDLVELVNCYDGTNVLNERYTRAGAVTIDRSTTLSGGASDDIGDYSLKLVSNANSDKRTLPLEAFWLDVENTATGSSKTATVEIISSASLNNDDISLLLEYMGTASSPVASFVSSLPAVLTTATALPTSSVTWNNPPGTPVKQYLQVTFTPQMAGRVRGLVRLGKASTTVWLNPQITIA